MRKLEEKHQAPLILNVNLHFHKSIIYNYEALSIQTWPFWRFFNMSKQQFPPQKQDEQPGKEKKMIPKPEDEDMAYKGSEKLAQKIALITGGDSGIGRAVAIAFAKEGADIAIV